MSKKLLLVLCLVFSSVGVIAQFHVGAAAGYSRSTFTGDTPPNEVYGWAGGAMFALSSDYMVSENVGILFDVNLHNNNALLQIYDDIDPEIKTHSAELLMTSLAFPIGLLVHNKSGKFYFKSALEFDVPIMAKAIRTDSERDILDQIRNVGLAVTFGLGYYIPLGKPRLNIGIDYVQGLTNLYNDKLHYDEASAMMRTKTRSLRFMIGVQIPLGTKGETNE